jgi:hypothetical protein
MKNGGDGIIHGACGTSHSTESANDLVWSIGFNSPAVTYYVRPANLLLGEVERATGLNDADIDGKWQIPECRGQQMNFFVRLLEISVKVASERMMKLVHN